MFNPCDKIQINEKMSKFIQNQVTEFKEKCQIKYRNEITIRHQLITRTKKFEAVPILSGSLWSTAPAASAAGGFLVSNPIGWII